MIKGKTAIEPFKTLRLDYMMINWYEMPLTNACIRLGWDRVVKKVTIHDDTIKTEFLYTNEKMDLHHVYHTNRKNK